MKDIQELYVIKDDSLSEFNRDVKTIVKDLQQDGFDVEVQYQAIEVNKVLTHSAMIIGRGK